MRKIIYGFALLMLFNLGLFANHGRVIVDVLYDELNGANNVPLRLVSYYDRHAATLDYLNSQLATIKMNQMLQGVPVTNIRSTIPVMDKNGNYTIDIIYDSIDGTPNMKYTLADLYNLPDIAKQKVLSRIQGIRTNRMILGSQADNIKIGDLQTIPDGYRIDITYDDHNGSGSIKYHVDEFYDPKKLAYDNVEDQLMDISIQQVINGGKITNLKEGPIQDVQGGYSAEITYDLVGGSSNMKYNIDDYYDGKLIARDFIHDQMQTMMNSQKVNSDDVSNFKTGVITDDVKNGKYTATVTYDLKGSRRKMVINSYYDPVTRAIDNLNQQIQVIKIDMLINGNKITNFRPGKIQVL